MLLWMTLSLAFAAKEPRGIEIVVLDGAGQPVPAAVIVFPDEREVHRVNAITGGWAGGMLYLPDGAARPLGRGADATFWASAPGMQVVRVDHVVTGRKKDDALTVTLQPLPLPSLPCLPEGQALAPETGAAIARASSSALESAEGDDAHACLYAARAWGWAFELQRLDARHLAEGSQETQVATFEGRQAAIAAVREWHDWAGAAGRDTADVRQLCGSVRGWPGSCGD